MSSEEDATQSEPSSEDSPNQNGKKLSQFQQALRGLRKSITDSFVNSPSRAPPTSRTFERTRTSTYDGLERLFFLEEANSIAKDGEKRTVSSEQPTSSSEQPTASCEQHTASPYRLTVSPKLLTNLFEQLTASSQQLSPSTEEIALPTKQLLASSQQLNFSSERPEAPSTGENTAVPKPGDQVGDVALRIEGIGRLVTKLQGNRSSKQFQHLEHRLTMCQLDLDGIDTEGDNQVRLEKKDASRAIKNVLHDLHCKADSNAESLQDE